MSEELPGCSFVVSLQILNTVNRIVGSNFEHCEQDCRLEPLKQQLTAQFHAESQLNSN